MTTTNKSIYFLVLLGLLKLFCFSGPLFASALKNDFLSQLRTVESLRLTDSVAFRSGLNNLEVQLDGMNGKELCFYQYLRGYEKALNGDFQGLKKHFSIWLNHCSDNGSIARMHSLRANIQVISGEFESSLNDLDIAIRLAEEGDDDVKEMAYSSASIVYEQMEQFDLSVKYAKLVYNVKPTDSNLCKLNYFQYNEKLINDYNGQFDSEIEKSIKHCRESNLLIQSLFLQFKFLKYKTNNSLNSKTRIEDIYHELLELEGVVNRTEYKNIKAIYWAFLAQVLEKMERLDEAALVAEKSLKENNGLGDTEQKITALDVKVRISLKKANDQLAYEVLKEKADSENRRFDIQQAKLAAFMKVKHENVVKEYEISQLNQKNKLLEMEQLIAEKQSENQRLMMTLLLVVVSFLTLWSWRAHKRQKELKLLSEMDHLTQVLNRQGLEANVMPNLKSSESRNALVNLAILDLDHFKNINDQFGHMAGDWALKHVIGLVSRHMNRHMVLGRLGGEEFAIWFFDTTTKEAKASIEEIRVAIDELDCSESGHDMHITASFGMSNSIESGYGLAQLLSHADQALYQAKNNGRNRVVMYQHKSRLQDTGPVAHSV